MPLVIELHIKVLVGHAEKLACPIFVCKDGGRHKEIICSPKEQKHTLVFSNVKFKNSLQIINCELK